MKKVLQIVLAVAIIVLAFVLYKQIMTPLRFQKEVKARESVVIERIKDIRSAERSYKTAHGEYTGSFDSLINFVLYDSLEFERSFGSRDDSTSTFRTEKFMMAAIDTVFGAKKLTPDAVRNLRFIPFSDRGEGGVQEFYLDAGILETQSGVKVPVFEAKAPYKLFLSDLNRQQLINMIDESKNVYHKYPGIKVGSMEQATNDAGNWE